MTSNFLSPQSIGAFRSSFAAASMLHQELAALPIISSNSAFNHAAAPLAGQQGSHGYSTAAIPWHRGAQDLNWRRLASDASALLRSPHAQLLFRNQPLADTKGALPSARTFFSPSQRTFASPNGGGVSCSYAVAQRFASTGRRSGSKPGDALVAPAGNQIVALDEWTEVKDEKTGETYYWNKVTGETLL